MLVVGAGPAGAELARLLAASGVEVLLVDRLHQLDRAAFSSAALPLAAIHDLGLPAEVVASRWRGWQLIGPDEQRRHWWSDHSQGVVLDFARLRRWLVDQAVAYGAGLQLGWRALDWQADGATITTRLRDGHGRERQLRSRWVVDASGQARSLLGEPGSAAAGADLVSGVGVEWLLQLPQTSAEPWADRLSFCLGSGWVSQGYGWVFPMANGQVKIGICRLDDQLRRQEPLGTVLQRLVERLLSPQDRADLEVLDRHGGLIRSTIRRREPHLRGRLIGLGDAISTANLLGGEGIRHAMLSSRILAPLLLEALRSGRERDLSPYPSLLKRALGWRWSLSGRLARRTWLGLADAGADRRLERLLIGLEGQRAEELSALLFDYRFERYGLRALPYLLGWR